MTCSATLSLAVKRRGARALPRIAAESDHAASPRWPPPGPREDAVRRLPPLTAREAEVVSLIDDGLSNKQIARRLLHRGRHGQEPRALDPRQARCAVAQRGRGAGATARDLRWHHATLRWIRVWSSLDPSWIRRSIAARPGADGDSAHGALSSDRRDLERHPRCCWRTPPAGVGSGATTFELYQADDLQKPIDTSKPKVSIYLYRVLLSTARRDRGPRLGPDGRRYRPSIPLDLHYLVTAWAADAQDRPPAARLGDPRARGHADPARRRCSTPTRPGGACSSPTRPSSWSGTRCR